MPSVASWLCSTPTCGMRGQASGVGAGHGSDNGTPVPYGRCGLPRCQGARKQPIQSLGTQPAAWPADCFICARGRAFCSLPTGPQRPNEMKSSTSGTETLASREANIASPGWRCFSFSGRWLRGRHERARPDSVEGGHDQLAGEVGREPHAKYQRGGNPAALVQCATYAN